MKKMMRWGAIATVVTAGAGVIGVLGPVAVANAATTGNFVICARGNYSSFAVLTLPAGVASQPAPFTLPETSTTPSPPETGTPPSLPALPVTGTATAGGACQDVYLGNTVFASDNLTVDAQIFGIYNTSGQSFYITTVSYTPATDGVTVDTTGVSTAPTVTVNYG
jgi:hypothetical protein